MPNTIKISSTISWTDGKDTLRTTFANPVRTQVGSAVIEAIQSIGTEIESVQLGDVVPGYVCLVNRDSTNPVTISSDNAGANVVAVLLAGEGIIVPTSVTALWAKATGGAISLLVLAMDA
jgi:hypothetical protein